MRFVSLAVSFFACSLAAQKALPAPTPAPQGVPTVKMPEDPSKYAAAAAKWFPVMDQTIEAGLGDKSVKGVFQFKNPRDVPVVWKNLTGSCTCSQADIHVGDRKYELRSKTKQLFQIQGPAPEQAVVVDSIPVGPGEEGRVEIHVDVAHGPKVAKVVFLDMHSTDTEVPMARLQLRVGVLQVITVSPPDITLGLVGIGEERTFQTVVTSIAKDFEVKSASPFPQGIHATWERVDKNGLISYVIRGTFKKDTTGDSNPMLEFQTNVKEAPTFQVPVHASVRPAIETKPTFFAVGKVVHGKPGSAKVTFTSADGKGFDVKGMHIEGLNVDEKFVTLRSQKDGSTVVVELEIGADAPLGLIKGEVVVDFEHPLVKQKRILFNGFVR